MPFWLFICSMSWNIKVTFVGRIHRFWLSGSVCLFSVTDYVVFFLIDSGLEDPSSSSVSLLTSSTVSLLLVTARWMAFNRCVKREIKSFTVYLEEKICPHNMETLQDAEQAIKYEVRRKHFWVLESIYDRGFQNPAGENNTPYKIFNSYEFC